MLVLKKNPMTKMSVLYTGNLRCEVVHNQSQTRIETDAPLDNKGKGERFSPTDLFCTSLATCILTTMAIAADERNWKFEGVNAEIEKIMNASPRRIGEIKIHFTFPDIGYDEVMKEKIQRYAHACPVGRSLHPEVLQTVTFEFN
ncbi:MAG: OsmC family protein [Sediminibacterium sp.]